MVKLPVDINRARSAQVRQVLARTLADGVHVLMADMSATVHCDVAAARMLMLMHTRASARGAGLWLVAPTPPVRAVLASLGVDRIVPVCPGLDDAVTDVLRRPMWPHH